MYGTIYGHRLPAEKLPYMAVAMAVAPRMLPYMADVWCHALCHIWHPGYLREGVLGAYIIQSDIMLLVVEISIPMAATEESGCSTPDDSVFR